LIHQESRQPIGEVAEKEIPEQLRPLAEVSVPKSPDTMPGAFASRGRQIVKASVKNPTELVNLFAEMRDMYQEKAFDRKSGGKSK